MDHADVDVSFWGLTQTLVWIATRSREFVARSIVGKWSTNTANIQISVENGFRKSEGDASLRDCNSAWSTELQPAMTRGEIHAIANRSIDSPRLQAAADSPGEIFPSTERPGEAQWYRPDDHRAAFVRADAAARRGQMQTEWLLPLFERARVLELWPCEAVATSNPTPFPHPDPAPRSAKRRSPAVTRAMEAIDALWPDRDALEGVGAKARDTRINKWLKDHDREGVKERSIRRALERR
jgi:hypothetical protein